MLKPTLRKRQFKDSEKGMAIIESIPVLFMVVLVFNFSLGFFGAVHSGILNSIGSYNYAIETFRFRSDLMYFRPGSVGHYKAASNRVHGTVKEGTESTSEEDKELWPASVRPITFNYSTATPERALTRAIAEAGPESERNYAGRESSGNIWRARSDYAPDEGQSIQTPRIWVKTVYGICINADCGGDD